MFSNSGKRRIRNPLPHGPAWRFAWPCILGSATLLVLSATAQAPVNRIPDIHSTDLTGKRVDLPAMLGQRAAVLVVGFSRESRDEATAWGTRLARDFGSSPDVAYYELAMLEDVPKLLRGLVLRSISRSVSERGKPHLLPLTSEEARWKAVTHFGNANDAYVLIVDSKGAVRWQAAGEPTEERYQAMRHALLAVNGRPS